MSVDELVGTLERGGLDERLDTLYGSSRVKWARARFRELTERFSRSFGSGTENGECAFFSSPGRTELAGNHVDHNRGRVLAGSVQLDTIACVRTRSDSLVRVASEGYDLLFEADLRELNPVASEQGKTTALIRGVAAAFVNKGLFAGGFDAHLTSNVLPGSGLSSSASVEVLFGALFNELWNDGALGPVEISKAGRFAENNYFGKPCGLMDQIGCAHGGVVAIDFERAENPRVAPVPCTFEEAGLRLLVVDTGGSHADLTDDYASIPAEMERIAHHFGGEQLRDVPEEDVMSAVGELRSRYGDRAVLRSLHFYAEVRRAGHQQDALNAGAMEHYLELTNESADSSWEVLQNCYSTSLPAEQGVPLALTLTRGYLSSRGIGRGQAACRVHGGGFAGTIQAYIPLSEEKRYRAYMENYFGTGCVTPLRIRSAGVTRL